MLLDLQRSKQVFPSRTGAPVLVLVPDWSGHLFMWLRVCLGAESQGHMSPVFRDLMDYKAKSH